MRGSAVTRFGLGAGLVSIASLAAAEEPAAPPPVALSVASVPAAGRHDAIARVATAGRFAFTARSKSGVELQIVDRMAGPGASDGTAGQRDGRIDVLLDAGEYKLVARGAERARDSAELAATPFRERNGEPMPLLVERRPVDGALEDFEQVSYWLEIERRTAVAIEAAGRNLSDLRLWRDGEWLLALAPGADRLEPRPGRPLRVRRIAAELEPGLYLLTAYGGPDEPWADAAPEHPFHLRYGFEKLGVAARLRRTMGPLGIERFLVPGRSNFFRLELREARPARLLVRGFAAATAFDAEGESADISKESVPPVAELGVEPAASQRLVTVTAPAGKPYTLQLFENLPSYELRESGRYWLSTIHAGDPADAIDATAIAERFIPGADRAPGTPPAFASVVPVDPATGWRRRFNLVATATLFLRIGAGGAYTAIAHGTPARLRFEPYFSVPPPRYQTPPSRGSGESWDLSAGFYRLTIEPELAGLADIEVRAVTGPAITAPQPVRPAARFGSVDLDYGSIYHVERNVQPEVAGGLVLRRLPLDLREPLPVALRGGETVTVELEQREAGTLRAIAEDGTLLDVALDGAPPAREPAVAPGRHTASVTATGSEPVLVSLSFVPDAENPARAAPTRARPAARPPLPVLAAGRPQTLDLDRRSTRAFALLADRAGLYEVETTGLLATRGVIRTRLIPELVSAEAGGSGRNFRASAYLGKGDYQLEVSTRGESAGHLGVRLRRTRLVDGGDLVFNEPARVTLAAGEAVAYRFTAPKAADYRIRALGLGRTFRCRLEDAEGWPVFRPGEVADFTRRLEPGQYRLVLLPEPVESRRVTVVSRIGARRRREGHGPHAIPLAQQVENLWLEPEGDAPRLPDVFEFAIPAPVEARVTLTSEMQGRLVRLEGDGREVEVARVPPGRGWSGPLAAGTHRLLAECARRNNRNAYSVEVTPVELVAGLDRTVTAPAGIPVSVGAAGPIAISSLGGDDVRAALLDEQGREIAADDDRPDDWNFHIAAVVAPGRYRLRIDPVGAASATTSVSLRVPRQSEGPELVAGKAMEVRIGKGAHVWPLPSGLPSDALALVTLSAVEPVGAALERPARREPDGGFKDWEAVATASGREALLAFPTAPSAPEAQPLRLRAWSLGRARLKARIGFQVHVPAPAGEAALAAGLALESVAGIAPATGVALVRPAGGLFEIVRAPDGLLASAGPDRAPEPVRGDRVVARVAMWLVAPAGRETPVVSARRRALAPGDAVRIPVDRTGSEIDLAPAAKDTWMVLEAAALAGRPLAWAFEDGGEMGTSLALGAKRAVAVATARERVRARVAIEPSGGEADLRVSTLPVPAAVKTGWGTTGGLVEPGKPARLALPGGAKRLRVLLAAGSLAVLTRDGARSALLLADGAPLDETVLGEDDGVVLARLDGTDAVPWSIEAVALDEVPVLAPGRPFAWQRPAAGRVRVQVVERDGPILARGAVRGARFLGCCGDFVEALATPVDGDPRGQLVIDHDAGTVVAWIGSGAQAAGPWGEGTPDRRVEVATAGIVALAGREVAIGLAPAGPVVLHARSERRLLTRLERAGQEPEVAMHTGPLALDVPLAAGASTLRIRPLPGEALDGSAEIDLETPLPIGQGRGPEVLIPPGGARTFAFTTRRRAPVGIGVEVATGAVEVRLLDARGGQRGAGVAQMPDLEPGDWLLVVRATAGGALARVRPALVGLEPPGTAPPSDVVRGYALAAGSPVASGPGFGRVTAPEPPRLDRRPGPRDADGVPEQTVAGEAEAGAAPEPADDAGEIEEGE